MSRKAAKQADKPIPVPVPKSRRGRESVAAGQLKIQQKHNRRGKPMCFIPLPDRALELLDWQPGQYLSYYPTKAGELVLVRHDAMLAHFFPDYDFRASAPPAPSLRPRVDSLAERSVNVDERLKELTKSTKLGKQAEEDFDE